MNPIAWEKVCLPKLEGGPGIRDLTTWNKALISKVLWNIHMKSDTLWIRWIHCEYLKGKDIWEIIPNDRDSPLIKRILDIRDKIVLDCAGNIEKAKSCCATGTQKKVQQMHMNTYDGNEKSNFGTTKSGRATSLQDLQFSSGKLFKVSSLRRTRYSF